MLTWRRLTFFAALLLLSAAAYDLLGVDFLSPALCAGSSDNAAKPYPDDDCFCCCAHVVLISPASVEPIWVYSLAESTPSVCAANAEPTPIYHPPRI